QPEASARPVAATRSRWARLKNPFRPQLPVRKVPAPLQAELSLDAVRVVRNDLNETDLEIVPAGNRPATPAPSSPRTGKLARERIEGGAAAPALPSPQTGKRVWERIRARFFGKRRT